MLDTSTAAEIGKVLLLNNGLYDDLVQVGKPGEHNPDMYPRLEGADSTYIEPFLGKTPGHIAYLKTERGRPYAVTLKEVRDA